MTITFLEVFDQFRFMAGAITAELVFIIHAASRRDHFPGRVLKGCIGCVLWSAGYFPWEYFCQTFIPGKIFPTILICIWWLAASFISIFFLYYCFHINGSNLLFRGSMGLALQEIITVFCQYCINRLWFPGLAEKNTILYVSVIFLSYFAFELLTYLLLARRMQDVGRTVIVSSRQNVWISVVIVAVLSLCTNFTSGVFEWSSGDWESSLGDMEFLNQVVVPYYCVFVLLVICIIIILIEYSMYEILLHQQENEILRQLEKEKTQQYEMSRENIDLINQKCHDLKYQIRALKMAVGSEREKLFEEADKAVQFYDAAVHTENQVLDTILTEKSLLCTKYNIRFSCNIRTENLDQIEVIDLYTMLGNAIDNAIECVRTYEEPEKRVISLSILENGEMLHIFVENFFDGELEIRGGFPVTGKKDKDYHGFGIKSINMLAKKYGGDSMVSVNNKTFSLHIMLVLE